MRPSERPLALVWPPLWTYTSVPADLTDTAGALRAAGVPTRLHDLSAGLTRHLLGDLPGYQALQRPETYLDPERHRAAAAALEAASAAIGARHRVEYGPRRLRFPDIDEDHVSGALRVGLDRGRNPALPYLQASARRLLGDDPAVIAIGLGFPAQRVGALALARLLRECGYRGYIALYGSLQDEIAPEDFADDLEGSPLHLLFRDFDGAVVGEAESALTAFWRVTQGQGQLSEVPNLLSPATGGRRPRRHVESLREQASPSFEGIDPALYSTPGPVIDLRLGRGCPWGRCTFCAIHAHQPGYRAGPAGRVAEAMRQAHDALGARFFRVRDDLVTPAQLRLLAEAIAGLPFRPRWSARVRFEDALVKDTLARAAGSGLEELWIGLESASERVRERMDKGVS